MAGAECHACQSVLLVFSDARLATFLRFIAGCDGLILQFSVFPGPFKQYLMLKYNIKNSLGDRSCVTSATTAQFGRRFRDQLQHTCSR